MGDGRVVDEVGDGFNVGRDVCVRGNVGARKHRGPAQRGDGLHVEIDGSAYWTDALPILFVGCPAARAVLATAVLVRVDVFHEVQELFGVVAVELTAEGLLDEGSSA